MPLIPPTTSGEFYDFPVQATAVTLKPAADPRDPRYVRTWAEVMRAIAASGCPLTVWLDLDGVPFVIPAGTWEMRGATLAGQLAKQNQVTLAIGAVLRNLAGLSGGAYLDTATSTGAPPSLEFDPPSSGAPFVFAMRDGAVVTNSGTDPAIRIPAPLAPTGGPSFVFGILNGGGFGSYGGPVTGPLVALGGGSGGPGSGAILLLFAIGGVNLLDPAFVIGNATTIVLVSGDGVTPRTGGNLFGPGFLGAWNLIPQGPAWSGDTAHRPAFAPGEHAGFCYLDTDVGAPIFWTGSAWIGAGGAPAGAGPNDQIKIADVSPTLLPGATATPANVSITTTKANAQIAIWATACPRGVGGVASAQIEVQPLGDVPAGRQLQPVVFDVGGLGSSASIVGRVQGPATPGPVTLALAVTCLAGSPNPIELFGSDTAPPGNTNGATLFALEL